MTDKEENVVIQDDRTPETPTTESTPEVSDEEREWSMLKGSTQDRVRTVIKERNEYKTKLSGMETKIKELEEKINTPKTPAVTPTNGEITEEQKKALETLRKFGVVTKEDLQALKDQQVIDAEYARLSDKYTGDDGRPTFDKAAIEKHMADTGIYNPEKAYEDLYRDELYDWKRKNETTETPYTVRPSANGGSRGGEPLTVESLRERLQKPDGAQWWAKNRSKILPILGDLTK